MSDENRNTTWRQGALFLLPGAQGQDDRLGVIASHDCDLCADDEVEPQVEYLLVELDGEKNGNFMLGKNVRVLQAVARSAHGTERLVTISVHRRAFIEKRDFYVRAIWLPQQLDDGNVIVFRRWLTARYGRSAFPNAFENLMRGKVENKIGELSKQKGEVIRGLYFDLDDNHLRERGAEDGPYELRIYVVYPPDTLDSDATLFAQRLDDILRKAFYDESKNSWSGVELISCDALSEDAFSLFMANNTKTWRVDHRSYTGAPEFSLFPEPDR